jgi:hypothetical protein
MSLRLKHEAEFEFVPSPEGVYEVGVAVQISLPLVPYETTTVTPGDNPGPPVLLALSTIFTIPPPKHGPLVASHEAKPILGS